MADSSRFESNTNANDRARRALVTGASSGIGAAFAQELASRGTSLVLTARRLDRLEALGTQLTRDHGVAVTCIAADLSDAGSPSAICAELARQSISIDILVNNAGYGVTGSLRSQPWQVHADFMQVMLHAPVELAWRLLPAMRERRFGRIINIASLAGLLPASAGHTLYAAAKSFLIRFSQSLALENIATGVKVCAICPGFTYAEFHDVNATRSLVSKMPKWMWMSADRVAREALDAAERDASVYVPGRINRTLKTLIQLLPDGVAQRSMARRGKRYRVIDDPPA